MTETKSNAHQLTVKKGILAIVAMYACQLLAGIAISYAFKIITPTNKVPLEIIGLASTLLSGILVLLLFWWDIHRSPASFYPQIGLQPSKIEKKKVFYWLLQH